MFFAQVANATLPVQPTAATNAWDLSWLPDTLKTPDTLFIVATCWAVGYLSRWVPPGGVPANWRPLVVLLTGLGMSFALVHPFVRAVGMALINVVISMVLYDQVLGRIETVIQNRRQNSPPNPTANP
jgi:hypothetical protein